MRAALRVGLIGCGAIGALHGRIVAEHGGAELVAACDLIPAAAAALAEAYGARPFTDAATMFAEAKLDAVIIASTEDVHVAHALLAAEAGVPMLIEKPVATDLAGIATIEAATNKASVLVMAGHVERFEIGSAQLQDAVKNGACGRIVSLAARRQFTAADTPRFAGRSSTLRLLAVHDFDLLCWVHPAPVVEIYAAAGRGKVFEATGLDDHVMTTLRYADGAIGMVESAWTLPEPYGRTDPRFSWQPAGNNRLDVFGSAGMVSNDMGMRIQQLIAFDAANGFRAAGIRHQPLLHGRITGALAHEVAAFLHCVATGGEPVVGLADARRAIALIATAEASLASGLPVAPEV